MKARHALPVVAFLFLLAGRLSAALQVGQPAWGFDGKVVADTFNIVSIEIGNQGARAFEGDLVLDDAAGLGARSSAPYKQHVFLAPGTSRWVQFHPYIGAYTPPWRLSWDGAERGSVDLGQPDAGPPATVLLADPDSPASRAARMRLFPENLFPPTVSATDGLHAVVLDHQPRWEATRRQAFLDWVRSGGIVHLVPGPDGAHPQFTDDLAALNVTGERGNVGSGQVVKHSVTRAEITGQFLKDAGFPPPEIVNNNEGRISDLNSFTFRKLASITKPDIAWGLIYFLTALYVILIGPVFYILRKRDYRLLLGGFIATVALFAWLFTVVGRRGYGEKQIYHSIAIARSLGGGRFDVQEWIHAFATSGDIYRFEHADGGHLYAAPGEGETVRGEIIVGKDSQFDADIPLFSSRPFLHRGVEKAGEVVFTVQYWEEDASASKGQQKAFALRIKADAGVRKSTVAAALERDGYYYELTMTENGFGLNRWATTTIASDFFGKHQFNDYDPGWGGGEYGDKNTLIAQLRSLYPVFISRANDERFYFRKSVSGRRPSDDRARLFVYADAPPEFRMKNDRFQAGTQLVLYVQDIFKP